MIRDFQPPSPIHFMQVIGHDETDHDGIGDFIDFLANLLRNPGGSIFHLQMRLGLSDVLRHLRP